MKRLLNLYQDFLGKVDIYISPFLPFYPTSILINIIDQSGKSVIDVGGGDGAVMKSITLRLGKRFLAINCDISLHQLKRAKRLKSHNEYIRCDIRNLPLKEKSVDIALVSEVLEHLEKRQGLKLLADLEKICHKQIVVKVPNNTNLHPSPDPQNPFQAHISQWTPEDFKSLGYEVRVCGPPRFLGESLDYYLPRFLKPIGQAYRLLGSLFGFLLPIGDCIIAWKAPPQ